MSVSDFKWLQECMKAHCLDMFSSSCYVKCVVIPLGRNVFLTLRNDCHPQYSYDCTVTLLEVLVVIVVMIIVSTSYLQSLFGSQESQCPPTQLWTAFETELDTGEQTRQNN